MMRESCRRSLSLCPVWMAWAAFGLSILWVPADGVAQTAAKKLTSEEKTLLTKGGISLKTTYFSSSAGKEAPVAILLHGKSGNRLVWKNFAAFLQQNDFAVVTVDLSGHGESENRLPKSSGTGKKSATGALKPLEYQAMVGDDLEAVKKLLHDEHQKQRLNMGKLAIAAADFSTAVAIVYADFDWQKPPFDDAPTLETRTPRGQDVKALVLLSPDEQVPGLAASQSLLRLKTNGIRAMIGVSKSDTHDKGAARRIYEHLAPKKVDEEKRYVYLQEYEGKLRGTDLLNQEGRKVETNIFNFLEKHVKQLPIEWRDRRSRVERDDDKK